MAANKRYIIQLGDTVRIDRKKVAKYCATYPQYGLSRELREIKEMRAMVGKEFKVIEYPSLRSYIIEHYIFPKEVCTKVMSPK